MTASTVSDPTRHQACGCSQVAVYGSLRQGGRNDIRRWQADLACLGRTWLHGQLYDLGGYPGLVLDGTRPVLAEVYALAPALECWLDELEGVWPQASGEYVKRIVDVLVSPLDGGPLRFMPVLVYEVQPAVVRGLTPINASDWQAWLAHRLH